MEADHINDIDEVEEEEEEEEVEDGAEEDETYPDKIYFGGERQVIDMAFHPSDDVLGAGIIDGSIEMYISAANFMAFTN